MSKSKIFIGICISFSAGVLLGSLFFIPYNFLFLGLGICAAVFAIAFYSKKTFVIFAALFSFVFILGIFRIEHSFVPSQFQNLFEGKQQLEGYIVEDIDMRTDKQLITFKPKGYNQNILITTTKTRDYFYGDWIVVEGKIAEPKAFDDFDYKGYLERYNVYGLMAYPKILILKNNQSSILKWSILKVKYAFTGQINKVLKEPFSSLLLGILIGARKTLPQNIIDNFNTVGLSHVVAVSGYNISIIISSLGFLAYVIGRRASFWLTLLLIVAFVIIAGASASVIRAAVMGSLLLLSFQIGRLYSITPAICAAAFIMLIINPKILYWDIGFQLSFLATVGIVYGVPVLEKVTPNIKPWFGLKGTVLTTISAITATFPIILYYFGTFSVVAIFANILVLPFVPLIMLLGFLSALPFLGIGFAYAAQIFLSYVLWIIGSLSRLPFASLQIKFPGWMLFALSALIIVIYIQLKRLRIQGFSAPVS